SSGSTKRTASAHSTERTGAASPSAAALASKKNTGPTSNRSYSNTCGLTSVMQRMTADARSSNRASDRHTRAAVATIATAATAYRTVAMVADGTKRVKRLRAE